MDSETSQLVSQVIFVANVLRDVASLTDRWWSDRHRVVLEPVAGGVNCEHNYTNTSYTDVGPSTQYAIHIYHWFNTTSGT